jgi:PPM family protein phosphatase
MIRVENTALPVLALTHPGMKGKNNEDSYGVSAFVMDEQQTVPVLLAVLCDGIGGHRAGEIASRMAVDMISQYAAESDGRNPTRTLQEAIHQASQSIQEQAVSNTEHHGMGTTCACVWIGGDRLYTATVGDSRIYLLRGNRIFQLSTDHTWIQEALERGLLQPEQVNNHPNAHVIRRYLGSPTLPEVDFRLRLNERENDTQAVSNQGMRLQADDRLVLCSDGLTDLVTDEEILGAFLGMPQEEAGNYLVNLANERGGHDNITLIGIHIPQQVAGPAPVLAAAPSLARRLFLGCLGVVLLGALIGGVLGGYILYFRPAQSTPTATVTATIPVQATLPVGTLPTSTQTLRPMRTPTPMRTLQVTRGGNTATPTVTAWPASTLTLPLPVVTLAP